MLGSPRAAPGSRSSHAPRYDETPEAAKELDMRLRATEVVDSPSGLPPLLGWPSLQQDRPRSRDCGLFSGSSGLSSSHSQNPKANRSVRAGEGPTEAQPSTQGPYVGRLAVCRLCAHRQWHSRVGRSMGEARQLLGISFPFKETALPNSDQLNAIEEERTGQEDARFAGFSETCLPLSRRGRVVA
jgi:hypothetical protein